MPVREKRTNGAARARHVPSLVPVYAQSVAKPRASPPTALEFTAETDSALEEEGFEPSVPRQRSRDFATLAAPIFVSITSSSKQPTTMIQNRIARPVQWAAACGGSVQSPPAKPGLGA